MVENHYQRHNAGLHPDPKIGRYFLFSLVLHLVVVLIFSGVFISRPVREHRPVYYVDLSRLPVANPRAGRPDGSLQAGSRTAASKPAASAPAKAAAPAPKPAKSAKTAAVKPQASKAKPVKKPASSAATRSKKAASGKAATEKSYQQTLKAMEAMREKVRRQQEIDALKERIAALGTSDTRAGGGSGGGAGDAPLGMPDGKGTEAGVSQQLWLQTWLKENWSFSRYQASRRDLVATTRITYDAEGNLVGYQFLKKSGDSNFDDSVKKAILKGRQLAFKPGRRFEVDVEFNLKDLKE